MLPNSCGPAFVQRMVRRLLPAMCVVLLTAWSGMAAESNSQTPPVKRSSPGAPGVPGLPATALGKRDQVTPSPASPAATGLSSARKPHILSMEVTAYCACKKCCGAGAKGLTASGKTVRHNKGVFVAADTDLLPFGTRLRIPGYHSGRTVEVIDRGGAIQGQRLDVFFPTHQQAMEWGRQRIQVEVIK